MNEIEIGGEVSTDELDDLKKRDFTAKQLDLFRDTAAAEPNMPPGIERVGMLGNYVIVRKVNDQKTYYLLDGAQPFGYVYVQKPHEPYASGRNSSNPPLSGKGLRVTSIHLDETHRGQNLGIAIYEWLLRNICDYILPDDMQTPGGVYIWKKMLNSRKFEVMVYDPERDVIRRRRPGKDFAQVYQSERLRPFVTLAGKAEDLISGDYVGDHDYDEDDYLPDD